MATYMDQFLEAIQRPSKKNMMKSSLFWKKFHIDSTNGSLCQFENGWVPPQATRWLYKISLLLVFEGQQARTEHWIKKDWPVCSELIPGSLNVLAPTLVERSKTVSSSSHKAWHHETVCEGS